ncbi:biotin--[acetyl-CoA-carboxylase] ligase [Cecembia calidifontis]|jgi:BirA family biotin operon repressor/biotin-[acetyl-CoA-carboxylase] ligase|uniref:biotin--[biotin carboxyl-carrier protein] ligase n=1 Tax=Cecembia calidifontis TaxID=1187080 RepID=A0A4Q7PAL0_9BACT|nr:biotin--[acetyl-CoA-carboxylase] ligase [Cecembia calidifontis]RZS96648.1 BirA family biotin operon repressor/biotin-[acetyl-CoA-carboxylase] ligase [Cecembia calidifontis]
MHKILANTVFLGKDIHFLTECHSTNDLALEKIRKRELAEGSIILTDSQTKGRGQRGNRWWSEPNKNLTFSLVLQPYFLDPSEQFELNIAVSLAAAETLSEYFPGIVVKWPNDILHLEKGKLGGILIENILSHKGIEYAVVGIGLNINQAMKEIPFATSLWDLTGKEWDRWEIFKLLIAKIEKNYVLLKKAEKKQLRQKYLECLYRVYENHKFDDGEVFEGEILGIDQFGKLIIKKNDGSINFYSFKEVKYL